MNARRFLERELALMDARIPYARCTVIRAQGSVPAKPGSRMLVTSDGREWGTVGGAGLEERVKARARELIPAGKSDLAHFELANWKSEGLDSICGGSVDVSIETVNPVPHVLLIGGGHVSEALARTLDILEYDVSVVDDRAEYAATARFPNAKAALVAEPAAFWADADPAAWTHAYILGYSHAIDTDHLVHLLKSGFTGVVGVIGSRAKWKIMRERAVERGIADDVLDKVRCPIGTVVPTVTVGEIAVAVAAEIVADHRRPSARG